MIPVSFLRYSACFINYPLYFRFRTRCTRVYVGTLCFFFSSSSLDLYPCSVSLFPWRWVNDSSAFAHCLFHFLCFIITSSSPFTFQTDLCSHLRGKKKKRIWNESTNCRIQSCFVRIMDVNDALRGYLYLPACFCCSVGVSESPLDGRTVRSRPSDAFQVGYETCL